MKLNRIVSTFILLVIGIIISTNQSTFAIIDENSTSNENDKNSVRILQTTNSDNARKTAEAVKERVNARLNDSKLQICKRHETTINNVIARVSDRDQKRFDFFDVTTEKVEAFYIKNSLMVANYDQLLATIATKKTAAQAAITTANSAKVTFTCGGEDPKGVVSTFKNHHSVSASALDEYKTAVRELVKAVKTAAEAKQSNTSGSN